MEDDDNIKSVLVFYFIDDESISSKSYQSVWNSFIDKKVEGVVCKNVFHCEFPEYDLLSLIEARDLKSEIFELINSEYHQGANFMFVNPVVGAPIGGFWIQQLLEN
jgi:hypothetical protein